MIELLWFFMFVGFMGFVEIDDLRKKENKSNSNIEFIIEKVTLWVFFQKFKYHLRNPNY